MAGGRWCTLRALAYCPPLFVVVVVDHHSISIDHAVIELSS